MKRSVYYFSRMASYIKTGNRIPYEFFLTHGFGESDLSAKVGSFHIALHRAGIASANIIKYSSILPSEAKEISQPIMKHGEVMEVIAAQADGYKNQCLTAGLAYAWLYEKTSGKKVGGLVCEYEGNDDSEYAKWHLRESLQEIYEHGFSQDNEFGTPKFIVESFIPQKQFGTALVALCFTSFLVPLI